MSNSALNEVASARSSPGRGYARPRRYARIVFVFLLLIGAALLPHAGLALLETWFDLPRLYQVDYRLMGTQAEEIAFVAKAGTNDPEMRCTRLDGAGTYRCTSTSTIQEAIFASPVEQYPGLAPHRPIFLRLQQAGESAWYAGVEAVNYMAWALLWIWIAGRFPLHEAKAITGRRAWVATGGAFVAAVANSVLLQAFETSNEGDFAFSDVSAAVVIATFASSATAAPLLEEAFFRGVAWNVLRRWLGPFSAAMLISGGFAVLHGYPAMSTLDTFVFSLIACWLRHRTNSFWYPFVVHAGFNTVVLVSALPAG